MSSRTRPNRLAYLLILVASSAGVMSANTSSAGEPEPDSPRRCQAEYGLSDAGALPRFYGELRTALQKADPALLAPLIRFPLRVNGPENSAVQILDIPTLELRFDDIFNAPTRAAVLATSLADVSCMPAGLMVGAGVLWAQPDSAAGRDRFLLTTVNRKDSDSEPPAQATRRLVFSCPAQSVRILIDQSPSGPYRLRSWKIPQALTEPPDTELDGGTWSREGSGLCAHNLWTFPAGTRTYQVSTLGCTDGQEPEGTGGFFSIEENGQQIHKEFCR